MQYFLVLYILLCLKSKYDRFWFLELSSRVSDLTRSNLRASSPSYSVADEIQSEFDL